MSSERKIKRPEIGTAKQIEYATNIIQQFEDYYPEAIDDLSDIEVKRLGERDAAWWINNRFKKAEAFKEVSAYFRKLAHVEASVSTAGPFRVLEASDNTDTAPVASNAPEKQRDSR